MDVLDSVRLKNDEKVIDIRPFFTMLYYSHNNITALITILYNSSEVISTIVDR